MVTVDNLGELADKADNLVAASEIPLPAKIHIEQLVIGLREMSATLKSYVIEQTGENPWE